jgi:hypothetical protein
LPSAKTLETPANRRRSMGCGRTFSGPKSGPHELSLPGVRHPWPPEDSGEDPLQPSGIDPPLDGGVTESGGPGLGQAKEAELVPSDACEKRLRFRRRARMHAVITQAASAFVSNRGHSLLEG